MNESQRTIAFVIIVGVSNKSGSVIAGMVAQLITEWWLSCTGQGAQRAPDSSNDILLQISNAFTLSELINSTNRIFCLYMGETADDGRSSENDNIYRAKEYILSHYSDDLSLNDVAEFLELHPNYLSAVFRKKTGVTLIEYLRKVRIEAAKSLLKTTNLKLYEIAEKTGYQNAVQFNRAFKKETGISPSDYRMNR